jgi:hypothetical protein
VFPFGWRLEALVRDGNFKKDISYHSNLTGAAKFSFGWRVLYKALDSRETVKDISYHSFQPTVIRAVSFDWKYRH